MRVTGLRRMPMLGVAIAMVIALSACAPPDPDPTPTPSSTAIFATEDDALQAAIDVYQKYVAAYFAITNSGKAEYESLRSILTDGMYAEISKETTFVDEGLHTEGTPTFDSASLTEISQTETEATVRIKFCQDISNVSVLDSDGNDVTPADRDELYPLEITVVASSDPGSVLLSRIDTWDGDDFC